MKKIVLTITSIFIFCSGNLLLAENNSSQLPSFVYPLLDSKVSSKYGNRKHPIKKVTRHHNGIDLATPKDTPIRAISAGKVIFADPHFGYGKLIVIEHSDGKTSHYGHCDRIISQIGKDVSAGEIIGYVGDTGSATGPHLHLEIRENGKPLDPLKIFPWLIVEAEG